MFYFQVKGERCTWRRRESQRGAGGGGGGPKGISGSAGGNPGLSGGGREGGLGEFQADPQGFPKRSGGIRSAGIPTPGGGSPTAVLPFLHAASEL